MSLSKYHYNPKTCRYEPTRTSFMGIGGYTILFFLTTILIFWGMLTLHSKIFLSERGKALKKENITMVRHQASIQEGLTSVNQLLKNLENKNSELHKKIFETPVETTPTAISTNENLIQADEREFRTVANDIARSSAELSRKSANHNLHFSAMNVGTRELTFLLSIPSIQPIENQELTKLVSGFGKRINPFHKGNYRHPGADFAAPRGTSVWATAKGIVVDIQRGSSLQAGYGNFVEIDHGNGLVTRYAHLEEVHVRVGQRLTKGFIIGTVGMSGGAVAPHVHYEIIRHGKQVDPVPYMMEKLSSDEYAALLKLGSKRNQSLD
ncbi:MAG: M23 family metallopeptidase [Cyclobacteriaceae bacterium]